MVLVVGFAGLMEIVHASFTDDRMGRAARAAARALALDPSAARALALDPSAACAPIRRELRLADDFDCDTAWTLKVDLGVSPGALPATLDAGVTPGTGDMVLVRIGWSRGMWSFGGSAKDAHTDDGLEDADDDAPGAGTVPMVAIGLARCEADLCGQGTP